MAIKWICVKILKMKELLLVLIALSNGNALDPITISSKHKTSCSKGLIKDTDRLIFVGEIHLDKPEDGPEVRFEIKPTGDGSKFIKRCFVLTKFCVPDGSECHCSKTKQTNKFNYVFNITADVKDSNGTFKLAFNDPIGKEVFLTFNVPEIIDPANTSFTDVAINGEEVKNKCNKHYKHGNLSVHAACKGHLLPCTLELFVNGKREEQGPKVIFETKYNITTKVPLTIKQNICNNDQITSDDLNCVIELNPYHGTNEVQDSKDIIIIVVSVVIPIIIASIITAVCLYCRAKKRKGKKTQIRTELNEVKEKQCQPVENDPQPEEKSPLLDQMFQEECNRLQTQIKNLQQKLKDVSLPKDLTAIQKDVSQLKFDLDSLIAKQSDVSLIKPDPNALTTVQTSFQQLKSELDGLIATQEATEKKSSW